VYGDPGSVHVLLSTWRYTMSVLDPVPAFMPPAPARSLALLCDLARLACCWHCFAGPQQLCNGAGGVHLARLARAAHCGLIRGPEISLVLALAGDTFTSGTVIGGDGPQVAPDVSGPTGPPVDQRVRVHREEAAR
jgi:hypothetical protein